MDQYQSAEEEPCLDSLIGTWLGEPWPIHEQKLSWIFLQSHFLIQIQNLWNFSCKTLFWQDFCVGMRQTSSWVTLKRGWVDCDLYDKNEWWGWWWRWWWYDIYGGVRHYDDFALQNFIVRGSSGGSWALSLKIGQDVQHFLILRWSLLYFWWSFVIMMTVMEIMIIVSLKIGQWETAHKPKVTWKRRHGNL